VRALVTGGTGFLGRHLVERLLLEGDEVAVLARRDAGTEGLKALGARVVEGDVRRWPSLGPALDGVDCVYHAAALVAGAGRWLDFLEINVLGTERLIQAALERGVRRIVHVSSIGVYPEREPGAIVTEDAGYDDNPSRGGYTRSKIWADRLAAWYAAQRGAPVTIVRPGTIWGPGGKNNPVRAGVRVGPLAVVFGDGANVLPLIYVDNVVDALLLAARREGAVGRAYHVVDDEQITQRVFLERLSRAAGADPRALYVPLPALRPVAAAADLAKAALRGGRRSPQGTYSRITRSLQSAHYDTARAKAELGWKPRVDFEGAMARIAQERAR
jgi:nucleoside-diphosphate-sugar epimerase